MLNGDAHHSLMWEAEPRILPLLSCQIEPGHRLPQIKVGVVQIRVNSYP